MANRIPIGVFSKDTKRHRIERFSPDSLSAEKWERAFTEATFALRDRNPSDELLSVRCEWGATGFIEFVWEESEGERLG